MTENFMGGKPLGCIVENGKSHLKALIKIFSDKL